MSAPQAAKACCACICNAANAASISVTPSKNRLLRTAVKSASSNKGVSAAAGKQAALCHCPDAGQTQHKGTAACCGKHSQKRTALLAEDREKMARSIAEKDAAIRAEAAAL